MASKVDVIIKSQRDIQGPLILNLHIVNDETTPPIITLGGITTSLSPKKQFKYNGRAIVISVITAITLAVVIGGTFAALNLLNRSDFLISPPTEGSKLVSAYSDSETKNDFRIVSKDEWLARPSKEPLDNLELPVHRVIIAHTATSDCSNQASCISTIQNLQNFYMDVKDLNDIGYNFLIGGDGTVYEGRGWNAEGAHTKGFNVDSISIAFIGTFSTLEPSEKQLNAGKWIIDEGIRLNKLVKDYRLYGARQLVATESPGNALYEIVKQWPNWTNGISK